MPMSENYLSSTLFSSFALDESLAKGLEDMKFSHCTEIQAESLPFALAGRDVAGQAQTGTGKTAAFLLATYQYLLSHSAPEQCRQTQPRALIMAPTRELAIQIHKDAEGIGAHTGIRLGLAYGGTGYQAQRDTIIAGVDILIGTPGRLIDYLKQRVYDLNICQVVVLDEADRMFDLGFIKDIRFMLQRCPPPGERLSLLFSATLSHRVMEVAYEHMNEPERIEIEADHKTVETVRQVVYYPANEEKIPLLLGLIKQHNPFRSIVFVNTKHDAERVKDYLEVNGTEAALISGDVPQTVRQRLLARFQAGEVPVLVATDVAARGLHIPDVSHVFNFDLPQHAEDYVHRVGRTARAGASGDAISFACEKYAFHLPEIEEFIGFKLPMEGVSSELLVSPQHPPRRPRKPRPGGRGGRGGPPKGRRGGSGGGGRRRSGR
jgi:ATP-dependent RNA helicase RhlB